MYRALTTQSSTSAPRSSSLLLSCIQLSLLGQGIWRHTQNMENPRMTRPTKFLHHQCCHKKIHNAGEPKQPRRWSRWQVKTWFKIVQSNMIMIMIMIITASPKAAQLMIAMAGQDLVCLHGSECSSSCWDSTPQPTHYSLAPNCILASQLNSTQLYSYFNSKVF